MMSVMKVLTVRQPWAGLIAHGVKDVENRTWQPNLELGARFAIHAGRDDDVWPDDDMTGDALCQVHGLIVATVRLVDVVRDSSSRWAVDGQWHWVLEDPRRPRRDIYTRGRLGLWDLDL